MPAASAVHDLPALTWLGTAVPCSEVQTSWQHRLPEFEYAYVDGDAHDQLGRKSLKVRVTLHFLNTYDPDLYPRKWRTYRSLLMSGQAGTLRHPDIGSFFARVVEGDYTISGSSPAGITVKVTFTESIKTADDPTKIDTTSSDAQQAAKQIDDAVEPLGLTYPDGMGDLDFQGMMVEIVNLATSTATQLSGAINQAIGYVDTIYQQMQIAAQACQFSDPATKNAIAGGPFRWSFETGCDSLRDQLKKIEKAAQQGARPVKSYTTTSDATLASLSLLLNADMSGMVKLNPALVKSPNVTKGTLVKYYADAA